MIVFGAIKNGGPTWGIGGCRLMVATGQREAFARRVNGWGPAVRGPLGCGWSHFLAILLMSTQKQRSYICLVCAAILNVRAVVQLREH